MELSPEQRAQLLIALTSLFALVVLLMLVAWWMARWTRRYVNDRQRWSGRQKTAFRAVREDDWAAKPLADRSDRSDSENQ